MPGARDPRVRVGDGDRPANGGEGRCGGRAALDGVAGGAGGGQVRREKTRGRVGCHGHLRYSTAEEQAVKREIEKGLRLRRLEQVRQQSRQHAAAVREEYRQRREENKRAVLRESKVGAVSMLTRLEIFKYLCG